MIVLQPSSTTKKINKVCIDMLCAASGKGSVATEYVMSLSRLGPKRAMHRHMGLRAPAQTSLAACPLNCHLHAPW